MKRIVDSGDPGEVSGPHRVGRDRAGERLAFFDPQAGVIAEEEGAIRLERASETAAELLQVVGGLGRGTGEVIAGVQRLVAVEEVAWSRAFRWCPTSSEC